MLAIYGRPDTWKWLLLFHILAAVVLVAASAAVTIASLVALRPPAGSDTTFFRRTAFRVNLAGVLPAFIAVILIGGALADREYPGDHTPGWLDAGGTITFLAGIISGILFSGLQYWALRRARDGAHRSWQAQVASYGAPLILAALLVVVFLMAAKPGQEIPGPV